MFKHVQTDREKNTYVIVVYNKKIDHIDFIDGFLLLCFCILFVFEESELY